MQDTEYWYRLGEQYACGIGVPRNYGMARRWFKKAARQGHADAQFRLDNMYKRLSTSQEPWF